MALLNVIASGASMECGGESACELVLLLTENEVAASTIAQLLGAAGAKATGLIGIIGTILREHGEKIIALLGFSFGVWRWWRYREQVLHRRLKDYLDESDRRLDRAEEKVLLALQRPGPGGRFEEPLFVDRDLRAVLRVTLTPFGTHS